MTRALSTVLSGEKERMMSGISGLTSNFSGFDNRLQARITSAAMTGQMSQADGTAIGSALGEIASQLQTSRSQVGAANTGPAHFRKKLDNLINGEVASGKLTDAQATELKGMLQPSKGGSGSAGGPEHGHRAKGAPDGQDKENDGDGDDKASASSSNASNGLTAALQASNPSQAASTASSEALAGFLKILQDAQKTLAGATYSNSAVATSKATSSLGLVNQIA
jgi:hypothetical protein